jgi:hypothetical protein
MKMTSKNPNSARDLPRPWRPIRIQMAENAEALFLTSGFVYDDAEQAEATFANQSSTTSIRASPIPP